MEWSARVNRNGVNTKTNNSQSTSSSFQRRLIHFSSSFSSLSLSSAKNIKLHIYISSFISQSIMSTSFFIDVILNRNHPKKTPPSFYMHSSPHEQTLNSGTRKTYLPIHGFDRSLLQIVSIVQHRVIRMMMNDLLWIKVRTIAVENERHLPMNNWLN